MATAGIQITLDKPRTMKLTFAELVRLEQQLSKPSGEIFADVAKLSMSTLQHVIFASLRHEDKKLKFTEIPEMLSDYLDDNHEVADLIQLVNETVTQSGLFGRVAGKKGGDEAS